jgi:Ca2+-binding RTX toxin-like protein
MPNLTLEDCNENADNLASVAHFGDIFNTFSVLAKQAGAVDGGNTIQTLTPGTLRYPGGSRADGFHEKDADGDIIEINRDTYEFTAPDLLVGDDEGYQADRSGKGLSDALHLAAEQSRDFSVVMPTVRYMPKFEDIDGYAGGPEQGKEDLKAFLQKLLIDGDYFDFEDLDSEMTVTIEIGNESDYYYDPSTGRWQYAEVVIPMIEGYDEFLAEHGGALPRNVTLELEIQAQNQRASRQLREALEDHERTSDLLSHIDELVTHVGLVSSEAHFVSGYSDERLDSDETMQAWTDLFGEYGIDAHDQATWGAEWNVGEAASVFVKQELRRDYRFATDWPGVDDDLALPDFVRSQDIGARQAGASVEVVTSLIGKGFAELNVWGTTATTNSYFYYYDTDGDGAEEQVLSHGGHAFRLMAESLPGTTLEGFGQFADTGDDPAEYYLYEDDAKLVLFLDAGGFGDGEVSVDLSAYGDFTYAWAEAVQTDDAATDRLLDEVAAANPGHEYLEQIEAFRRAVEVPEIVRSAVTITDGVVTYGFTDDYETVRIILAREDAGVGSIYLVGTDGNDRLSGGMGSGVLESSPGDDTVDGHGGSDWLFGEDGDDDVWGGPGDDHLFGGAGDDLLDGGPGNDSLEGGAGNDTLYGGSGSNYLSGGAGNDTIYVGGVPATESSAASELVGDRVTEATGAQEDSPPVCGIDGDLAKNESAGQSSELFVSDIFRFLSWKGADAQPTVMADDTVWLGPHWSDAEALVRDVAWAADAAGQRDVLIEPQLELSISAGLTVTEWHDFI